MGTITNFAGKYTDPNLLNLPPGAAREAVNVVSDRPGVAECRVGQEQLSGGYETNTERLLTAALYGTNSVEQTTTSLYLRDLTGGVSLVSAGEYPATSGSRMRFAVGGDDLYMATSEGVKVMDGVSATPSMPGAPRMLDFITAQLTSGTGSLPAVVISDGESVAYRAVLGRYDGEGREILGVPSGRIVATQNVGGSTTYNVRVIMMLPTDAEVGMFLRVYRTTATAATNPGDVMYLVHQHDLTSSEVSGRIVNIVDGQPAALMGEPLYTNSNSTGGGIAMSNYRPPLAQEVVMFRQSLFLADVTFEQRLMLSLIGVPTAGTVLTIAGEAYTAVSGTADASLGEFSIYTVGSVSQNVERTARNLVNAINFKTTNTRTQAFYVSGENDAPGMVDVVDLVKGQSSFTAVASTSGDVFVPSLTSAVSSVMDTAPNGISVSKSGLFYAFPSDSAYRLRLGRADKRILRLMVNRDSLFAFKEDGVWVIYPAGAGWGYRQISTDVILQYPDSLAVLDNQIYAFTTRGIVAVDESGIEEVDAPIKNYVSAIRDSTLNVAPQSVFAVADPVRLRYYLFYSDGTSGNLSTQALVYNAKTDTWTERDDSATGGYIGADGLLYLGQGGSKYVRRDRNTGTTADYMSPAGDAIHVTIEWASIISENPSGASRFTEMHLLTEEPTEGPYTFTFTSHYGESETCQPEGENLPEVRMWVPDGVQRTTRLRVRMERDVLEEYFAVLGITNSAKYYRGPATRG